MRGRSAGSHGLARWWAALTLCAALVLLAAAGACLLAGCSSSGSAPSPTASPSPTGSPRPGGTYNFPLRSWPSSIVPFGVEEDQGAQVGHQIFEGLVAWQTRADGTILVVPCLAQSWSANSDASVWTFKLRRGVRFQAPVDREVTAQDVVADFRYVADPASDSYAAYMYAPIAGTDDGGHAAPTRLGVAATDRYTVRVTLKRPFAEFPDTLGSPGFWVWPVDELRRVGRTRFQEQPVGTGPFTLSRWVRGESIDLARNPDWWDAASGRPYVDTVHFTIYPSVSAELQAFQKGDIDYTWVPKGQVAASRTLPQVTNGSWSPQTVPLLALGYLAFNMDDPVVGGARGLPLRQALNYLCDRQAMIDASSDGVYRLPTGLVPPILPGWQEQMLALTYDPAKAVALYEQAGSPKLSLLTWDDKATVAVARELEKSCARAGVSLTAKVLPLDAVWERVLSPHGAQAYLVGWVADYPAADNFLYDLFYSELSPGSLGTKYANAAVDDLLLRARATADPPQHLELDKEAARRILADLPADPLFEFVAYRLTSNRIGGFHEDAFSYVDMWDVWVR